MTIVFRGLLRRIGIVLLAAAFLGGAFPRLAITPAEAAPSAGVGIHAHHAVIPEAMVHCHDMPATPAKAVPGCQHGSECLICAAIDLTGVVQVAAIHQWVRLTFGLAYSLLSGMTPLPELFPPIQQS